VTYVDACFLLANNAVGTWPDLHIHLFKNDFTPDETTVLGDFVEADYSGYAVQDAPDFTDPGFIDPGVCSWTTGDLVLFDPLDMADPDQNCYGFYITDNTDTVLLNACRFVDPWISSFGGLSLLVGPTWTLNPA